MVRLSDFVTCRRRYCNQSWGLYLSFGTLPEDEILKIPSSDTDEQNFYVVKVE